MVLLGALCTFTGGLSGILYRESAYLIDKILSYVAISAVALLPFVALTMLVNEEKPGNRIIYIGGIVMGVIGGYIYLSEMVFSKGPVWEFSYFFVPVMQLVIFLILWSAVAITRRSRTSR